LKSNSECINTSIHTIASGTGITEFSRVGFGYVGYEKSQVLAGIEIPGTEYLLNKTKNEAFVYEG